ncbi:glycosyltransferase family protein [Cytobacillus solani]|uniref:glycosyltransferase family protein n=1 Tax=Cytobacillus solani TaxID=1637975 RepID=UPI0006ABC9B2|nr:glycosyltransferase family protein [Cytobacillus solani]
MNTKKISFISCVNNFEEYDIAIQYIHSLKVPDDYEIETIAIENAVSLTSGYNQGMARSDAKYKVYLHQDTNILYSNFIYHIIYLFEKYPKLGMLGVIGAKTIPNGIWYHSPSIYGSVYQTPKGKGEIELLSCRSIKKDYEKVRAIDGLIMITQYDLVWREDLIPGWHFYDVSQSLEFQKAGYNVGVPKQITPWCIHDCGIVNLNGYDDNWKKFSQHYNYYID